MWSDLWLLSQQFLPNMGNSCLQMKLFEWKNFICSTETPTTVSKKETSGRGACLQIGVPQNQIMTIVFSSCTLKMWGNEFWRHDAVKTEYF